MKDFFENPELLFGLPILILGIVGVGIPLLAAMIPDSSLEGADVPARQRAHPTDNEYFKIFITLGVITLAEIALFYIELGREILIPTLVVMSGAKFFLVVAWFMHLRFDSPLFTTAFVTGLVLAFAVFTVVMATLGSNLV
jgi:cytochrome c oxidase subunit 4